VIDISPVDVCARTVELKTTNRTAPNSVLHALDIDAKNVTFPPNEALPTGLIDTDEPTRWVLFKRRFNATVLAYVGRRKYSSTNEMSVKVVSRCNGKLAAK
jgi:hypothetical protein